MEGSGLIGVGMAIECCGEHMFSAEQLRMHDEMYHSDPEKEAD